MRLDQVTTFFSNVAPPKIPLRPKPQPWTCRCVYATTEKPGYLAKCTVCGMRRPS